VPVTVKEPDATPVMAAVQLPLDNVQLASTVPTVMSDEERPTLPEGVFAGFVVSDTVTVQEPVRPALTEAEHDTVVVVSSFGGGVKVTATLVGVVVAPSGEPVTISVNGPVGVDAEVEIVKTLEPVGVTGLLLVAKLQPTPVGRGVTHDRVTGTAVPAVKVAVTVTVPELPWTILTGPLFDSE